MHLFEKNTNKKAFTLTEALLGLLLVGIISAVLVKTIKPQSYEDKNNYLMAYKALETMNSVFNKARQQETTLIPTATFMTKTPSGGYEFTVLSPSVGGALADTTETVELLGKYMKKSSNVIDFCTATSSCENNNIKGYQLPGNLYIGIEKYESITNCPSFYMPNDKTTEIPAPTNFDGTSKQCWGNIHIDTNGPKPPNTQNEDYFVFGLDEYGIVTSGS